MTGQHGSNQNRFQSHKNSACQTRLPKRSCIRFRPKEDPENGTNETNYKNPRSKSNFHFC